jgi:hypothetical protein
MMAEVINLEARRLCKRQQEIAVEVARLFHLDVSEVQEYAAALAEQEMTQDAKLLDLWRGYKKAMAYELEARSQMIAHQRSAQTMAIENEIMSIEPEGPVGEIIKLGLRRFGYPVLETETERYRELVWITKMDVIAELNALFEEDKGGSKVLPFRRQN